MTLLRAVTAAGRAEPGAIDLLRGPLLAIAATCLVAVSLGWIVVWWFALHGAPEERAERRRRKARRDIWKYPPEAP
ncbi:MAG: hypothetical protein ABR575_10585 [Actinomycetota bacterium]